MVASSVAELGEVDEDAAADEYGSEVSSSYSDGEEAYDSFAVGGGAGGAAGAAAGPGGGNEPPPPVAAPFMDLAGRLLKYVENDTIEITFAVAVDVAVCHHPALARQDIRGSLGRASRASTSRVSRASTAASGGGAGSRGTRASSANPWRERRRQTGTIVCRAWSDGMEPAATPAGGSSGAVEAEAAAAARHELFTMNFSLFP